MSSFLVSLLCGWISLIVLTCVFVLHVVPAGWCAVAGWTVICAYFSLSEGPSLHPLAVVPLFVVDVLVASGLVSARCAAEYSNAHRLS